MEEGAGGREVPEPSDAFRRTAVLLGIVALDLTSLLWMYGGGAFALLPEPPPATWLGTSQNVLPLVVGMTAVVILMYRRQEDLKAGRKPGLLFRLTLYASIVSALLAVGAIAMNLRWVVQMLRGVR